MSCVIPIAVRISQTWRTTFLFVSYTLAGNLFTLRPLALWPLAASLWASAVFVWAQWFLNDLYDRETDRLTNAERPTTSGAVPLERLPGLFIGFTLAAGLPLVFVNIGSLLAFAAVAGINVAYSAPPLRLRARPLPSVLCLSAYTVGNGVVDFLAQGGRPNTLFFIAVAAALAGGALTVSYKDLKDALSDPASGVRNFVTRWGVDRMKRFLALSHAACYVGVPLLFGVAFILPAVLVLGALAVFMLLTYSVEKGGAVVYRLDLLNAVFVQLCGWSIWGRHLGFL